MSMAIQNTFGCVKKTEKKLGIEPKMLSPQQKEGVLSHYPKLWEPYVDHLTTKYLKFKNIIIYKFYIGTLVSFEKKIFFTMQNKWKTHYSNNDRSKGKLC